jgi:Flp pilus assembly pilin Flp
MKQILYRLWHGQEGQDLTEYGLLLVLVALAAIASMNTLGSSISDVFSIAAANLAAS